MIEFLKKFFSGEEIFPRKQRDIILLDAYAMNDNDDEETGGCGSGGCGSCGCGG